MSVVMTAVQLIICSKSGCRCYWCSFFQRIVRSDEKRKEKCLKMKFRAITPIFWQKSFIIHRKKNVKKKKMNCKKKKFIHEEVKMCGYWGGEQHISSLSHLISLFFVMFHFHSVWLHCNVILCHRLFLYINTYANCQNIPLVYIWTIMLDHMSVLLLVCELAW